MLQALMHTCTYTDTNVTQCSCLVYSASWVLPQCWKKVKEPKGLRPQLRSGALSGKHEALGIIPTQTGTKQNTLMCACTLRSVCSVCTLPGSSSHTESRPLSTCGGQSTQSSALQAAGLHTPQLDWTPDVHPPLETKAHQCNL